MRGRFFDLDREAPTLHGTDNGTIQVTRPTVGP